MNEKIKELLDEEYRNIQAKVKKLSKDLIDYKKRLSDVGKSRAYYGGASLQRKPIKQKEPKKEAPKQEGAQNQ